VRAEQPRTVAPVPASPNAAALPAPSGPATVETAAAPQPEPTAPAQAALLASTGRLEFRFQRESWIEVKDGEGTVLVSALHRAGATQSIEGRPPFTLVVGNAAGVKLRYNDADVDLARHARNDVARLTLE
jgi:cytoskeleton protein RodZ